MTTYAADRLREQTRGAINAEMIIGQAAELKSEKDLMRAIEALFLHCAHLSDLIFRSGQRDQYGIDRALKGLNRGKLKPLNSPVFDHIYRSPKAYGSVLKMPAAITPGTWVVAFGADTTTLLDLFDAVEALALHLGELHSLRPPNLS